MQKIKLTVILATLLSATAIFADEVPIIDAYQDSNPAQASNTASSTVVVPNALATSSTPSLSLEQRVTILERQMSLTNQQLVQINNLQQQIQDLRGKLELEKHTVQALQDQVKVQYQDLDSRLTKPDSKIAAMTTKIPAKSTTSGDAAINDATATTEAIARNKESSSKKPVAKKEVAKVDTEPMNTASDGSNDNNADQVAYQAAFDWLKKKNYVKATEAFQGFIKKYPDSQNIVNARYWLGQLYLLQGQPDRSIDQFQTIVKKYSQDKKVPDALLQLGLAYYAKGDTKRAVATLKQVQTKYADSKAADIAKARLQQIPSATSSD